MPMLYPRPVMANLWRLNLWQPSLWVWAPSLQLSQMVIRFPRHAWASASWLSDFQHSGTCAFWFGHSVPKRFIITVLDQNIPCLLYLYSTQFIYNTAKGFVSMCLQLWNETIQHGQLTAASSSLPSHLCQVIAGELNMANSPWGQLTTGGWRDRQMGRWTSKQVGRVQRLASRCIPFSQPFPPPCCCSFSGSSSVQAIWWYNLIKKGIFWPRGLHRHGSGMVGEMLHWVSELAFWVVLWWLGGGELVVMTWPCQILLDLCNDS